MSRLEDIRVVDAVLTGVAQGYKHPEAVYPQILPVKTAKAGKVRIPQFGKESFKLYQTGKAPYARVNRITWSASYLVKELERRAIEIPIDRTELEEALNAERLRMNRTKAAQKIIELQVEYDAATLLRNTANYPSGHTVTLSGTSQWNDYTNSDPITDIETGKEVIRTAVGVYPNVLLLSAQAFRYLKHHPKIVEKIKYTVKGTATEELLAEIFNLEKVIIGTAVYVDSNGNFQDVWGKDAILAFVPTDVIESDDYDLPAFGYTIRREGYPLVTTYIDNPTTSYVIQSEDFVSPWMTSGYAGYLIKNAVA